MVETTTASVLVLCFFIQLLSPRGASSRNTASNASLGRYPLGDRAESLRFLAFEDFRVCRGLNFPGSYSWQPQQAHESETVALCRTHLGFAKVAQNL